MIKKLDDYKMKLMKNRKEFIFSIEYFFFQRCGTNRERRSNLVQFQNILAKRNFSLMVPKVGIKGDLAIGPDFPSLLFLCPILPLL